MFWALIVKQTQWRKDCPAPHVVTDTLILCIDPTLTSPVVCGTGLDAASASSHTPCHTNRFLLVSQWEALEGEWEGARRYFFPVFSFLTMRFQHQQAPILFWFALLCCVCFTWILWVSDAECALLKAHHCGTASAAGSAVQNLWLFPVLNTLCQKCRILFLLSWLDPERSSLQPWETHSYTLNGLQAHR